MTDDSAQNILPVDQAIAAFEQRQLDTTCPRCQGQNWDVQVMALEAAPFPAQEGSRQRYRIPTVFLTCYQCGNMYLHNLAILLGQTAGGEAAPQGDGIPEIDDLDVEIDETW